MDIKKVISIGIPTFNRSSYLEEAILSCFQQHVIGDHVLEIIVSDNASSDDTLEVLERLLLSVPEHIELKIITHKEVIPVIKNWDECLRNASGEYFLLLSDDDKLSEYFYETVVHYLVSKELDEISGILTGFDVIDSNSVKQSTYALPYTVEDGVRFYEKLVMRRYQYRWCSFLCRRSVLLTLQPYNFPYPFNGASSDGACILACCIRGNILIIPDNITMYRVHANNGCRALDIKSNIEGRRALMLFSKEMCSQVPYVQMLTSYWCADGYTNQVLRWTYQKVLKLDDYKQIMNDIKRIEQSISWRDLPFYFYGMFKGKLYLSKLFYKIMNSVGGLKNE